MAENKVTVNSVVLLGAVHMDFTTEAGDHVLGVQVWYSYLRGDSSDRQVGAVPAKAWFPGSAMWPKFKSLAGQYPVFAELVEVRRSTTKGMIVGASDFDVLTADPRLNTPALATVR